MDEHFAHGVEYGRYVQFHRQKKYKFYNFTDTFRKTWTNTLTRWYNIETSAI